MSAGYAIPVSSLAEPISELPNDSPALHWYAAYTRANHEKRISEQLSLRGVQHFLPLYASTSQWKDRRVTLHRPLFPGYVFVRISIHDRQKTYSIPGISRLVGFGSVPKPLPDDQIEALQASVTVGLRLQPYPFLTAGRRVLIKRGPFSGMTAILLRRKGNLRVVVSIELIERALTVEAAAGDLELEL